MGRFGMLFGAVWLVYLAYPLSAALEADPGPVRAVSVASVVVFAAVFLQALTAMRRWRRAGSPGTHMPWAWGYLLVEAALVATTSLAARESALAGLVFMAVTTVFLVKGRPAAVVVALLAVAGDLLPRFVPGWEPDDSVAIQVALAGMAVFGVTQVMTRNGELARARTELADLAVARERERMARDVHDLLGHSLTVITIKSELAGRLLAVDPAGAAREIGEVEALARGALADVRATVSGFRAVGLANELAAARAALTAAGVDAQLPSAVDDVREDLRELFAWAVREGATNVVRHSGARRCEITVDGRVLVVSDDGRGPATGPRAAPGAAADGTGLLGLRERAGAVGARVSVGRAALGGFELRVEGAP